MVARFFWWPFSEGRWRIKLGATDAVGARNRHWTNWVNIFISIGPKKAMATIQLTYTRHNKQNKPSRVAKNNGKPLSVSFRMGLLPLRNPPQRWSMDIKFGRWRPCVGLLLGWMPPLKSELAGELYLVCLAADYKTFNRHLKMGSTLPCFGFPLHVSNENETDIIFLAA